MVVVREKRLIKICMLNHCPSVVWHPHLPEAGKDIGESGLRR